MAGGTKTKPAARNTSRKAGEREQRIYALCGGVHAGNAFGYASSLISNRDAVASQMDTKLREVLAQYNIDLQYISVTNFDFTDTFTDAVEAKVKAQQEKEKAETDADKRRVEAQATADADLIAANAEAEKSKVAADAELYVAEKKAEANRALNDSLNSNLLEYYKITDVESRWNGELPAYVGDGNSIPIINGIN